MDLVNIVERARCAGTHGHQIKLEYQLVILKLEGVDLVLGGKSLKSGTPYPLLR